MRHMEWSPVFFFSSFAWFHSLCPRCSTALGPGLWQREHIVYFPLLAIHTHTHALDACTHTYTHVLIHEQTNMVNTHKELHTLMLDSVSTHTFIWNLINTRTHICIYIHIYIYIYIHVYARTHTHTLLLAWPEQPGSVAGQHVSVIHPCHSGQHHEGGGEGSGGRKRVGEAFMASHSTPTLLPSAHPLPPLLTHSFSLTHTNTHTHTHSHALLPLCTTSTRPSLVPVPAPPAWVSAKEDTWHTTDRPKAARTPSDPHSQDVCLWTSVCTLQGFNWFVWIWPLSIRVYGVRVIV